MWSTWPGAAEEFLLLDLNDESGAETTMRAQWLGPPVLRTSQIEMNTRARSTARAADIHEAVSQQETT